MQTLELKAEISTDCVCMVCNACGLYWIGLEFCDDCAHELAPAGSCVNCWGDSLEWVEYVISEWAGSVGDPSDVEIIGRGVNWDRQNIAGIFSAFDIVDALKISGDYRLRFTVEGCLLLVNRFSHDEPTGAAFEIRGLDKIASNGERVYMDTAGRFVDSLDRYGYSTRLAGNYVCYTCGHVCECGDD